MANELNNRRIAFLVANEGVEQVELTEPWQAVELRTDAPAVEFLRTWAGAGKPIASICHGPWTLVEADVVRDKTLTSWPSLKTDIRNAGGDWRDEQVWRCDKDYSLVTSRKPDDLPAFCEQIVDLFA